MGNSRSTYTSDGRACLWWAALLGPARWPHRNRPAGLYTGSWHSGHRTAANEERKQLPHRLFEGTGYQPGIRNWLHPGHPVGGYPNFDGWPRFTTIIHQQMYIDWLKRTYEGGLRLMVAHVVNNELLAHEFG